VVNIGSGQIYKDASGNVGIGTASSTGERLAVVGAMNVVGTNFKGVISALSTDSQAAGVGAGLLLGGVYNSSNARTAFAQVAGIKENSTNENYAGALAFYTRPNGGDLTERLRIDSSGNVGIGTASPEKKLSVYLNNNGARLNHDFTTSDYSELSFSCTGVAGNGAGIRSYRASTSFNGNEGDLRFYTNTGSGGASSDGTEALRIDSSGNVLAAKTSANTSDNGVVINNNGRFWVTTTNVDEVCLFNRQGTDGKIVRLFGQNTEEGDISVSGTTVSYNGGHLARWSQLPSGQRDPAIKKGTVLSNLDAMCEWRDADGNLLANEQLNKVKISNVEGDLNTAGVFVNWDDDDQDNPYDLNMAMTGDMIIRIAQGTSVNRGDLLMSAGDGTAKPQGDDIIRSKTIAKVTSTNVTFTYEDGSYCVPCVLMAC
jgi:hypothetical protein